MSDKVKPVHRLKSGSITVAVWENAPGKGPRYTVTTSRSYKKDDEWKDSNSYSGDELMTLCKLLDMAHTWIVGQSIASRAA
jgi:hypothetical protein